MAALQLYRQSAVGDTLSDALHEMVADDKIPGDLATKVMAEFDEAMNKALEKEVTTKTTFKGHLDSYRFCDQVWTWVASDVVFRNDTASLLDTSVKEVRADKVKIVCVDARVAQS
ncbi:g3066 [Coccomyxa viridis]|uniref:Transcription initiation factor IIA subunit 2 n=1 Tax=Coccomyxa viridis TaxID=1274662 RepID=A0ABP1FLX3_9CHLO